MATFVLMPQKGLTEESAILSKWHVKKGDVVATGQYLFSIETGKATFDVESESSGTVLETVGNEGDELPIKAVVCVVGEPGERYELPGMEVSQPHPPKPDEKPLPAVQAIQSHSEEPFRIKASPRARLLAQKRHVDLRSVTGSGPHGRILEDDVRVAPVSSQLSTITPPPSGYTADNPVNNYTIIKHSAARRAIARNMHTSLKEMAQLTLHTSFDATELIAWRKNAKASGDTGLSGITIGDMVVFAASRAIKAHPELNAHYSDDETKQFSNTHIGIAVDTARGLMVPTVTNADRRTLGDISKTVRMLADACRNGTSTPEQMSGATFTISNLGAFGVTTFTPVINPPQIAILGVGAVEYKRRLCQAGMEDYPAIALSLTIDHRAIDGAPAARFLQTLVRYLERFALYLSQ